MVRWLSKSLWNMLSFYGVFLRKMASEVPQRFWICMVLVLRGFAVRGSKLPISAFLDAKNSFFLAWMWNDTHIEMEYSAPTLGWMAFGLSPNGGMNQSDVMIAWVDSSGKTIVQDKWLDVGPNGPSLTNDLKQDWQLIDGRENGTHTTVRVTRAMNTCDPRDRVFTNDTMRIIYSSNPKDPTDMNHTEKHTIRGAKSILFSSSEFLKDRAPMLTVGGSLQQMDVRMEKVHLPTDVDTFYYCRLTKLPELPQDLHIIGVRPLIEKGNEGMVHHILIYLCDETVQDSFRAKEFVCAHEEDEGDSPSTKAMQSCTTVWTAWAMGGGDVYYPKEAGLPVGPSLNNRYLMMEVHYDLSMHHPGGNVQGHTDSSGISFILTDKLREYDAAVMMTGMIDVSPDMIIPPNTEEFVIYGTCEVNCTASFFPSDGIHVFQALLHTHLQGRKVYMRHVRGGVELEPVAKDDSYDFNYQANRELSPPRKVLPGDRLIVECYYSTTGKMHATMGGFRTQDEMCLVYITYYPATKMVGCGSSLNRTAVSLLTKDRLDSSSALAVDDYNFWPRHTATLQDFYNHSAFWAVCSAEQGTESQYMISRPEVYAPYHANDECQSAGENRGNPAKLQATTEATGNQMESSSSKLRDVRTILLLICIVVSTVSRIECHAVYCS